MDKVPQSIAVLMDGNRRYARAKGIPQMEGHEHGMHKIKELVQWARDAGIREIILYGFSTENWNRASEEVAYLMDLFARTFGGPDLEEIIESGFRVRVIGQRTRLPKYLQQRITEAEERTKDFTAGTLTVAISYGGRAEIVDAVNTLIASGATSVDEATLGTALWSSGLRDPDLIIRPGGEQRLSNFLPWQSVYSELFFVDTFWPAFSREEFDAILSEYAERERRHGK